MARFAAAFLFFFMYGVGAQAQSGWEYLNQSPERLIGLLDLPDIVGTGCGSLKKPARARATSSAAKDGPSIGVIYLRNEGDAGCPLIIERADGSRAEVPTLESGYEIAAAIVYERRGPWFRIRLKEGSAWVRRSGEKEFLPYPQILDENLAYILKPWDGRLHETAGSAEKMVAIPAQWTSHLENDIQVEYLGSQRVGSDTWMHIRLATERCGESLEGVMPMSGWIPAYRSNGSPAAWFSSRGC